MYRRLSLMACLLVALSSGRLSAQCTVSPCTFSFTGAAQTWTVPAGVTSVHIEAWGAQGGFNTPVTNNLGGQAEGDLAVTPGDVLNIYVGGHPGLNGLTGGFNGGGNGFSGGAAGGGASDVRAAGNTLNHRVIVAGGGGGGGIWTTISVVGGVGGGLTGGNGFRVPSFPGGGGGTQSSSANGTCGTLNNPIMAGGFGFGGSGTTCGCQHYGGGGGWYGGGGSGNCRGGGGGYSYLGGVTTGVTNSGVRAGHGEVVISFGVAVPGMTRSAVVILVLLMLLSSAVAVMKTRSPRLSP